MPSCQAGWQDICYLLDSFSFNGSSAVRTNPIGLPGIITKLIRTVNHFIGKENTGFFSQAISKTVIGYLGVDQN